MKKYLIPENIFKDQDPLVVRWLFALILASNDLGFLGLRVNKSESDYERTYYFRLAHGCLREAAKIIREGSEQKAILSFLDTLNEEARDIYKAICDALIPFSQDSLVGGVLKNIRDDVFHYPSLKDEVFWPSLVTDVLGKQELMVAFSNNDDEVLLGHRYLFADELIGARLGKKLSSEIVSQTATVTVNLMGFIDRTIYLLLGRQGLQLKEVEV